MRKRVDADGNPTSAVSGQFTARAKLTATFGQLVPPDNNIPPNLLNTITGTVGDFKDAYGNPIDAKWVVELMEGAIDPGRRYLHRASPRATVAIAARSTAKMTQLLQTLSSRSRERRRVCSTHTSTTGMRPAPSVPALWKRWSSSQQSRNRFSSWNPDPAPLSSVTRVAPIAPPSFSVLQQV